LIHRLAKGRIEYTDFPQALQGKYQSFTEANLDLLRIVGWNEPFASLEDSIDDYCNYLEQFEGYLA